MVESSAAAAGAQWVAAESSTAAAGWSAAAEAQRVAAGWSTAAESSMAAARWSAPEYMLDSFKKFERERERGISTLTHIGSVNFELDTRSIPRCSIGHLGWGREG